MDYWGASLLLLSLRLMLMTLACIKSIGGEVLNLNLGRVPPRSSTSAVRR